MASENAKVYDPAALEAEAYRVWLEERLFHAEPSAPGEAYCIVIPPPNVTGALHLGHAINNTLQDVLIRWHRMRGFNTLWMPGIDHAGIATQAVVEKQLKEKENKTRHDVGREGLVERIWQWKEQYGSRILEQLKRMGCSCDWDRARFTLDEQCARAVRETFFKLFRDGLIYRGKRLVNWDVHLQTSISDDEIYHETVKTSLWHVRYPIVGGGRDGETRDGETERRRDEVNESGPEFVTVATTRPETMLGDTAVAVHSEDPRWNWAIGKMVELPLTGRRIPIIADDILVDPKFGSGVVKVTPAHDPNDYAVWQRHIGKPDQIDLINILNSDGTLNENAGKYAGMKREPARKKVVEDLTLLGLLEKEEPYETQVGHSDRSKTPVEPYLSDQWFVKMAPLAEPALEVVRDQTIKFFPERHAQQYLSWLGEKRDWPISRQLWWGHRIPVWSKTTEDRDVFHEIDVLTDDPLEDILKDASNKNALQILDANTGEVLRPNLNEFNHGLGCRIQLRLSLAPGCDASKWERNGWMQDPDVLDTWFSSGLWPHSTLGWPEETAELEKWYPTSVLATGRDIITLWVARMVMLGMYNMGESPLSPSPGTPAFGSEAQAPRGEGRGEGSSNQLSEGPHPDPLPAYRERGEEEEAREGRRLGVPFRHVYIHPTILDGRGERMSKSKGNGVDPIEIIETHGADAMRFTLASMATETQDVRMPVKKDAQGRNTSEKFDLGRNFANKIWNVANHFVISNLASLKSEPAEESRWSLADRWIIARFHRAVAEANAALEIYRFDQYAKACYDFVWNDFCDWYVEISKPALKDPARAGQTAEILAAVLDGSLRLLHPIIPFITETLWWRLNEVRPQRGLPGRLECPPSKRLIKAAWPAADTRSEPAEEVFGRIQEIVKAIRKIRNDFKVETKRQIDVSIRPAAHFVQQVEANRGLIELMSPCRITAISTTLSPPSNSAQASAAGCEIFVQDLTDANAERERIEKLTGDLRRQIQTMEARLANPAYAEKAPAALVQQTRNQLAEAKKELEKLGK